MENVRLYQVKKDLQQISDMLLLNGTLAESPGLVNGKIGIAIFFFHYALFDNNDIYLDYAMDLIDEMLNQMDINSPTDYANGLSGIGVGIDYLIRNKYLSVDDDICEEFDDRILCSMSYDHLLNFNQYEGLIGYGRYWITRLRYQTSAVMAKECLSRIIILIGERWSDILISEQMDVLFFLYDLQSISGFDSSMVLMERCLKEWNLQLQDMEKCFPRLGNSVVSDIVSSYHRNKYFKRSLKSEIDIVLGQIPNLDMRKSPTGIGLLNGYAGEGMLRLTVLEQTNISWMDLL